MLKERLLKNLIYPIVKKILHKSAKHYTIKEKYDQLVVYAYDSVSSDINLKGIYEKELLFFLRNFLKEKNLDFSNHTALDIGAYIGNHSIFFSKLFSEIISFEPHPTSFEILKINCKKYKNIKLLNFGCSDINTNSFLRLKHTNIGGSSISDGKHERDVAIKLIKLDDFFKDYSKKIGLVKIDAEGHESKVINGSLNILKINKPIILMELRNYQNDSEPDVIKKLKSIGYDKFFELENKIKFDKLQNNIFLSFIDKIINLVFENQVVMKEIKLYKKKEYQNIIII